MRRHDLDVVSLVFGLFFVGAAAIWGLPGDAADAVRGGRVPALLIVVGLIGLITSVGTRRARADTTAAAEPAASPAATWAPTTGAGPADGGTDPGSAAPSMAGPGSAASGVAAPGIADRGSGDRGSGDRGSAERGAADHDQP